MPLPFRTKYFHLKDDMILWIHHTKIKCEICGNFAPNDWNKIVADFDSDKEWKSFLDECEDYAQCYILCKCNDGMPIGFSYFIQEDEKGKIVSSHGGGWHKSMKNSLLYYRGYITMIHALLALNLKVRTSCLKKNNVAKRFIRSTGFVQYKETATSLLFWINEKRLHNSPIYKRIYQ